MSICDLDIPFSTPESAVAVRTARVDATLWRTLCVHVAANGARLVALWGSDRTPSGDGFAVHAAYATDAEFAVVTLGLEGALYPDISDHFPVAIRMQRALQDLMGLRAISAADQRKWLRHAAWPSAVYPLRKSYSEGDTQVFDFKKRKC